MSAKPETYKRELGIALELLCKIAAETDTPEITSDMTYSGRHYKLTLTEVKDEDTTPIQSN